MLLGHLVLGRCQSLPQLRFIKLLLGTDGLPDVRHAETLKVLALTVNCPTVSWSGHNIALRSRYVSLGWDWGQQQHRTHIRDQTAHNISQHLTTSLTAGELQVNTKLFQSVHSKTDRAGLAWVVTGNVISCRQRD